VVVCWWCWWWWQCWCWCWCCLLLVWAQGGEDQDDMTSLPRLIAWWRHTGLVLQYLPATYCVVLAPVLSSPFPVPLPSAHLPASWGPPPCPALALLASGRCPRGQPPAA
jgi:hypothetical protein